MTLVQTNGDLFAVKTIHGTQATCKHLKLQSGKNIFFKMKLNVSKMVLMETKFDMPKAFIQIAGASSHIICNDLPVNKSIALILTR